MKIVVLDGYTLNPGDLSWSGFEELGELTVYDRSAPGEVLERSRGFEAVITNKAVVSADTIRSLDGLKYIGVTATGVNIVDVEAAAERGIPVTNVGGYGPESVAQMVFAHILNITNQVSAHATDVKKGGWSRCPDFAYWLSPLTELKGLTLGIVGLGEIGSATARIAMGFGMKVIAYTRDPGKEAPPGIRWVGMDDLFAGSDVVSLHCPLTEETEHLVNRERLQQMKSSAILINTSRGPLVDEAALAWALDAGEIAAAGLDVLSNEPPEEDNPLLSSPNCWITPHNAWASKSARSRLMDMSVNNLKSFLRGQMVNCVNLHGR